MSDLVALLGRDNVDRLAKAAGGTRVFVPKHFGKPPGGGRDSSARLTALFGESLAVLLVFHFGDSTIYVPRDGPPKPINRRRLKRLDRQGLPAKTIARLMQCSERTVERHRARNKISKREETKP